MGLWFAAASTLSTTPSSLINQARFNSVNDLYVIRRAEFELVMDTCIESVDESSPLNRSYLRTIPSAIVIPFTLDKICLTVGSLQYRSAQQSGNEESQRLNTSCPKWIPKQWRREMFKCRHYSLPTRPKGSNNQQLTLRSCTKTCPIAASLLDPSEDCYRERANSYCNYVLLAQYWNQSRRQLGFTIRNRSGILFKTARPSRALASLSSRSPILVFSKWTILLLKMDGVPVHHLDTVNGGSSNLRYHNYVHVLSNELYSNRQVHFAQNALLRCWWEGRFEQAPSRRAKRI